ncbi:response regulator [Paenibacillus anaericanus]|uniref:Response regulator n=1 Tax=Paenibacillus anaericanus TaxID=170367 RepID=A0A433Y3Z0_9BACL|nr:response regulator [Paenibacillus anaericanus]RUT42903.1 response regulator [Paenibacillus anaericanus]
MAKILIVDDAAFMRMMLRDILEKGGHTIVGEAENGKVAIEKHKSLSPDVTTMDITMPVMEGIEAVKHIKAADPKAKIIMCSAMGQQNMVIQAIQAGAQEFVIKPFHSERILISINKVLGA